MKRRRISTIFDIPGVFDLCCNAMKFFFFISGEAKISEPVITVYIFYIW